MTDKITRLCGILVDIENHKDAVQPVAAELQQAIRDRVETVRQDFVDVALIDRIGMTLEGSLRTK
jgi:hypothetical protein